jgi:multidrug resistance protein
VGGERRFPTPVTRRERRPLPPGFGTIWITVALDLVGFGIVLPILPLYAEHFGATPRTIGLLVASFSLAQLICAPLWGRVSDRFGRKPVLIVSLAGTAVGSLLTGLAGSLWLLFLARILDGVSGASVSVAQAAVADVAEPSERPRLYGLLGAAFGVGFVIGPAIGGLASLGGRQLPFLIAASIAAVNAVVAARRLPETRVRPSVGTYGRGATTTTARSTAVGRLVLVAFVSLVAFSGFEATFALLGERRLHLSTGAVGAVFTAIGVMLVVVQVRMVGPANERLGEAGALRAGLGANALGLLLLSVDGGWTLLVPALVLLVIGQGLVTPTLSAAVGARAHADRRGAAYGLQQSAGGLARVVGPALAGLLFQDVGIPAPYLVGAALVVAALSLVPRDVAAIAARG